MSDAEQRIYERYGLELAVRVKWTDASGTRKELTGTTSNISSSGIYMVCECCLHEGCEIELEMDIPVSMTGGSQHCVCARGRVLRNEPVKGSKNAFGHAVVLHDHSFTKED